MANSITTARNIVSLVVDSDWLWSTTFPALAEGLRVHSITFVPGSANDKCVIKHTSDAGATIFHELCPDAGSKTVYFDGALLPLCLDFSDGVYNSGHRVIIRLWVDRVLNGRT
jgi:hypothetical protein